MRIYKTRWLARFARRERIADASLKEAIERAERGLVDADLGKGIIKQRIARPGQGRSRGYRMLIAYHAGECAVFLYGFGKSERDNISSDELLTLRETGVMLLAANADRIAQAIEQGALQELTDGEEETT